VTRRSKKSLENKKIEKANDQTWADMITAFWMGEIRKEFKRNLIHARKESHEK